MGVKCVFYKKCKSDSDKTRFRVVMFHKFPDAQKDEERYKKWLEVVPNANSLLSTSRYVCSLHFKEDDYLQPVHPINGRLRLKSTAVPSIFDVDGTIQFSRNKKPKNKDVVKIETQIPISIENIQIPNDESLIDIEMSEVENDSLEIDINLNNFSPTNRDTTVEIDTSDNDTEIYTDEERDYQLNNPDSLNEDEYYTITTNQDTETENNTQDKANKNVSNVLIQTVMTGKDLSAKLMKSRTKASSLQRKVRVLNKSVTKYKTLLKLTRIEAAMEKNVSAILNAENESIPAMLFNNEIKNQPHKMKGRDYTNEIKKFCTMLYKHSPKAYKYIRERSSLPHPKTVRTWQNQLKTTSGENIAATEEDSLEEFKEEEAEEVVADVEHIRMEDLENTIMLDEEADEDSDMVLDEDEDISSDEDYELDDDIDDCGKSESEITHNLV